jgi:hypothetical protein
VQTGFRVTPLPVPADDAHPGADDNGAVAPTTAPATATGTGPSNTALLGVAVLSADPPVGITEADVRVAVAAVQRGAGSRTGQAGGRSGAAVAGLVGDDPGEVAVAGQVLTRAPEQEPAPADTGASAAEAGDGPVVLVTAGGGLALVAWALRRGRRPRRARR